MSTRERILDAALAVMEERGLARATTKEIAKAAGCSEPLLYRYFPDKQSLFMDVLLERLPPLTGWDDLAGEGTVEQNLTRITERLLAFYLRSFPIAASTFSDRDLLERHRSRIAAHGGGPGKPAEAVQHYLAAEVARGRLAATTDVEAIARIVAGAALFEAFLARYADRAIEDPEAVAARIAGAITLAR